MYEQLVEREKRVKGQEASVSTALGERERTLQVRQDQLAAELQERERRLRAHEDECLATDRQLTTDKAALDRARQVTQSVIVPTAWRALSLHGRQPQCRA